MEGSKEAGISFGNSSQPDFANFQFENETQKIDSQTQERTQEIFRATVATTTVWSQMTADEASTTVADSRGSRPITATIVGGHGTDEGEGDMKEKGLLRISSWLWRRNHLGERGKRKGKEVRERGRRGKPTEIVHKPTKFLGLINQAQ